MTYTSGINEIVFSPIIRNFWKPLLLAVVLVAFNLLDCNSNAMALIGCVAFPWLLALMSALDFKANIKRIEEPELPAGVCYGLYLVVLSAYSLLYASTAVFVFA